MRMETLRFDSDFAVIMFRSSSVGSPFQGGARVG